MQQLTIVDLVLHAASVCPVCRQGTRPKDESDQEHGDQFTHAMRGGRITSVPCEAATLWALIRRIESQ